ncbi:MAG: histidine phosphatase family protein [Elusimicrobia bacterium]|nr:histidine phosphatase family protein [Elusimicrobiota bacterium]
MPTQILLIRHGETTWNKEYRIQGQTDIPLSDFGEDQARRLGARLKNMSLHAAYSSDSSRARRTAEIALEGLSIPLTLSFALRERHFGQWQGRRWDEIEKDSPEDVRRFYEDSLGFAVPGGETWIQMQDRVFQILQEMAARHSGRTVAVFTHGGPCKAAVFAALHLPAGLWRQWVIANASIQRLIWEGPFKENPKGPWKLAGLNDIAHLEESQLTSDPSALTLSEKEV